MSEQSRLYTQCVPVSPPQHRRRVREISFLPARMGLACFGRFLMAVRVGRRLTTVCRRFTLGHWRSRTPTAVGRSSQELILLVAPAAFTVRRTAETVGSRSIRA